MAKPYGPQPYSSTSYPGFHASGLHDLWFPREYVAGTKKALTELWLRDWLWADEFKNRRLNKAGLQAAKEIPKPEWHPPKAPILTESDFTVLRSLEWETGSRENDRWATPMDCGGTDGSNHSASLTKLTRCGLAECKKGSKIVSGVEIVLEPSLFKKAKGSRYFRITDSGRAVLRSLSE